MCSSVCGRLQLQHWHVVVADKDYDSDVGQRTLALAPTCSSMNPARCANKQDRGVEDRAGRASVCTAGRSSADVLTETEAGSVPVSAFDRTSKKKFAWRSKSDAGGLPMMCQLPKAQCEELLLSKKAVRAQSAGMAPDSRL